jgi:hypothetical protein
LCNKALDCTANTDNRARRRGVDLIQVAHSRRRPSAYERTEELDICPDAAVAVFADVPLKLPAFLAVVAPETPRWMGRRALAP